MDAPTTNVVKKGRIHHTLYSAQRNKEVGNGKYAVSFPNDSNADAAYEAARIAQAIENAEYKERVKRGENIERKFFPKKVASPSIVAAEIPLDNIGHPQTALAVSKPVDIPPLSPNHGWAQPMPPTPQPSRLTAVVEMPRTPFVLKLDPYTGNTTFLLGSSKAGKSTTLMHIYDTVYADKSFISILWTINPQIKLYRSHRKLIIGSRWNKESEEVIKIQHQIQKKTSSHYKFLNMLDDVLHVRGSKLMDNLVMTYRNSRMSTVVSMQYTNQLQKNCRANINNVLLFRFNTDESIEVAIKCFLIGHLKTLGIVKMPDMINWYKLQTKDHGFIYTHPASGDISYHRLAQ